MRVCTIEGCEGKHCGRGLCRKHLRRLQKHGDPLVVHTRGIQRYELADLLDLLDEPSHAERLARLGACTGMSRNYLDKLTTRGLTPEMADRLACAAGFHPCEVWPEWFDEEKTG